VKRVKHLSKRNQYMMEMNQNLKIVSNLKELFLILFFLHLLILPIPIVLDKLHMLSVYYYKLHLILESMLLIMYQGKLKKKKKKRKNLRCV